MSLVLFVFVGILYYSNALCNYVEFSLMMTVPPLGYQSLGTFSVSTNRCQSIKTLVKYSVNIINQEIKGSLQFTCEVSSNQIILKRYSDEYCSDAYISDQGTFSSGDEYVLIKDFVKLDIKDMECSEDNCMVSSAFGEDCTFSQSNYYFNISVPPNKCETLSTSLPTIYEAIIENVEAEVLPPEFALELSDSSIKFACCQDYSLIIFNYSDSKCHTESNSIRIPNSLNDACLDISNYGTRRRTLLSEYIDNQRRLQQAKSAESMVLSWKCDELITCDGTTTEDDLPPTCDDSCSSWAWDPVTTSMPQRYVTSKNTKVVVISIAILVIFVVGIIIVYGVLRYKSMSKQVISQQQNNKQLQKNIQIQNDSKYKPMIEESIDNQASVIVPQSISSFDNNNIQNDNIPASFENQNYITVATMNDA